MIDDVSAFAELYTRILCAGLTKGLNLPRASHISIF